MATLASSSFVVDVQGIVFREPFFVDSSWIMVPFSDLFIMFFFDCSHNFLEHHFYIDMLSIWMQMLTAFWISLGYLFHSCTQPARPSITLVFRIYLNDFTIQEDMHFYVFHVFFRYECSH